MSSPTTILTNLPNADLPVTNFLDQHGREANVPLAPLQPNDADIAHAAEMLAENASLQSGRRFEEITDQGR